MYSTISNTNIRDVSQSFGILLPSINILHARVPTQVDALLNAKKYSLNSKILILPQPAHHLLVTRKPSESSFQGATTDSSSAFKSGGIYSSSTSLFGQSTYKMQEFCMCPPSPKTMRIACPPSESA